MILKHLKPIGPSSVLAIAVLWSGLVAVVPATAAEMIEPQGLSQPAEDLAWEMAVEPALDPVGAPLSILPAVLMVAPKSNGFAAKSTAVTPTSTAVAPASATVVATPVKLDSPAAATAPDEAAGECHPYSWMSVVEGEMQELDGSACLQADGTWKLME